ncbi:progranulin isoform X1 [Coregonus clupeaformis]|uniref:progranulin isoform X1 n=1 Tax=Coregonus clupeaformis TaxID=59861 RepID=UPI001BE058F1|nr:progranulin isoform X1 [Coregonus clupeaformis]
MWSIAALVLVLTGPASCYVTCPDGKVCSDQSTCCLTNEGYACCPVPHAVCCSDMAHCCPSGFLCNTITQMCEKEDHPWSRVPTLKKVAAEEPSTPVTAPLESDSSRVQSKAVESSMVGKVQCDSYYAKSPCMKQHCWSRGQHSLRPLTAPHRLESFAVTLNSTALLEPAAARDQLANGAAAHTHWASAAPMASIAVNMDIPVTQPHTSAGNGTLRFLQV